MSRHIIELLRHDPRSFTNLILLTGKIKHNKFYTAPELSILTTLTITSLTGTLKYALIKEPIIIDDIPYIKTVKDSLEQFGDGAVTRTLRQYDNDKDKLYEFKKTGELSVLGYDVPVTILTQVQSELFHTIQEVHDNMEMKEMRELLSESDGLFGKAKAEGLDYVGYDFVINNFKRPKKNG